MTLFGTWNACIFHHLNDHCNSLRRRTHLPKRTIATLEDAPRKRHRPLPGANGAADGRAVVGGVGVNGFIFKAPGRGRSTKSTSSSSSSSSDTSSDNSSDDTSSDSESTSGSTSDSDSDSTSSLSSDFLDHPLPRLPPLPHLPRPPPLPSSESQRKPSRPRYVASTLSRIYFSAAFVSQAYLSTAWIWEARDPETQ